jgi:hypothetical protein
VGADEIDPNQNQADEVDGWGEPDDNEDKGARVRCFQLAELLEEVST